MEVKFFGRWPSDVEVKDPGLKAYICLIPRLVPCMRGRHAKQRFGKAKVSIVERIANKILTTGHRGRKHWFTSGRQVGKKLRGLRIVERAFELIEQRTGKNPIEVLIRAIEFSAPREEVTTIEQGGIRYPKAVDVSPQRRVDLALRWLCQGAHQKATRSKLSIEEALAQELIAASQEDQKSFAVSRRIDIERQAAASR